MKLDEFLSIVTDVFSSIIALTETKGKEYARSDDQLANFKRAAEDLDIDPLKVWSVFFGKHVDAIKSYVKLGPVARLTLSEPIEGRIDDAILYLILLRAIIQERKGIPEESDPIPGSGLDCGKSIRSGERTGPVPAPSIKGYVDRGKVYKDYDPKG
jgi:hypothetical protein